MSDKIITFIKEGKDLQTVEGHNLILDSSIQEIRAASIVYEDTRGILINALKESNDKFFKIKIYRAIRNSR